LLDFLWSFFDFGLIFCEITVNFLHFAWIFSWIIAFFYLTLLFCTFFIKCLIFAFFVSREFWMAIKCSRYF
jgi:hypothetical protein